IVTLIVAFLAAMVGAAVVVILMWSRLADLVAAPSDPNGAVVGTELLAQHRSEMHHQLDRVTDLMNGLANRQALQHGEMAASLNQSMQATADLAHTTSHLRRALASPKTRGQWGERMAEDVLRHAGFTEGISFRRQVALPNGSIPDVTFLLPGDLLLHMDVKFPLDNYLRASEAETLSERNAAETAFLRDVRQRVKEISGRGYVEPGVTVDHVLLFIPNESVYSWVHEHDPQLADLALSRKVVLCSPFTLFAVLGVIRQSVEAHDIAKASDEILECLAGFDDQWRRFADQLDVVAKRFDTAHKGLEELTGTRRRMLERQLDRVERLRSDRGLSPGHDDLSATSPRLTPVERAG
ncbi:MAG: DNA recombination protein RmuC, partial [Aquihabitans sp.]